ncbi:MAG: terpene cyclase/mutase family protein [Rhodopirellula sp.]|nr:terpene cyclase/mutase family protein [Rhodopirellula sp.]
MNRCLHILLLAALLAGLLPDRVSGQGTPSDLEVDRSIVRALKFLAEQQQPSGAWQLKNPSRGLDAASTTSLAIMAFMAAGHVPGEGPYGEAMEHGIRWVLGNQRPGDGLFQHRAGSGPMYTHGICTLMLAEVAGMVDASLSDRVRQSLERAIRLILKAQAVPKGQSHAGGWRYHASSNDSDLSVTGWQLLALRAAKNIGCDVPAEAIDQAVSYVNKCADRNGGFSYHPNHGVSPTRSGTGILCLEICGEHHAPATMAAADYLMRRPLKYNDSFFFYGVYYCTVGMFQVGGRHWDVTRNHITSELLSKQHPNGSWNPTDGSEASFGPIYATSMSVLALAVEYQYLPIYQR